MGYRPVTATTYQELGGGVVIYADGSGGLGLANKASGALNINNDTRVLVNAAGQMGLGTLAPSQKLHLVSAGAVALRLDNGDLNWDLQADSDQKFRLRRSGESLFSVNRDGQVAIGTEDTPASLDGGDTNISACRLYVEGGILTKEVRVRGLWADYVFEADYQLLSLPQVEAFIAENGHLPNTPSASEIEARGLDLGETATNFTILLDDQPLEVIDQYLIKRAVADYHYQSEEDGIGSGFGYRYNYESYHLEFSVVGVRLDNSTPATEAVYRFAFLDDNNKTLGFSSLKVNALLRFSRSDQERLNCYTVNLQGIPLTVLEYCKTIKLMTRD